MFAYGLLDSNQVNISTIAQVSRILSPENKDEVLARIRGKVTYRRRSFKAWIAAMTVSL
ncbi:MAG: hypothetical protein L0Z51_10230 [Candidatus Latescibacteria bacterium]|nr:hypothetical protein [Candidatus Latescibacterota bacterium]